MLKIKGLLANTWKKKFIKYEMMSNICLTTWR